MCTQVASPVVTASPLFRSRVHEVVYVSISRTDMIQAAFIGHHTEYIVEVNEASGERSTVSKRYRNFLDLHSALTQLCDNPIEPLPELPPKRIFGNFDADFIEERRSALEIYLQRVLRHPSTCTAEPLWTFLDVDDATITIVRFLGPLQDEGMTLKRLEDLKMLLHGDNTMNLGRISQDLVIERLIKCTTTIVEDPLLLTRSCLTLTQICLKCPGSRNTLVRLNSIPSLLTLLERFSSDAVLTGTAREFLYFLLFEYPQSLVMFFRMQHGLSQMHRIVRNPCLSLFHSFLGLLLWIAIEQPELQAALSEPDGLGVDVLGSLYRSPNATARLLCGLVISFLILNNKFHSEDVFLQAARSVAVLPGQLSALSCRTERFGLKLFPVQLKLCKRKYDETSIECSSAQRESVDEESEEKATIVHQVDFCEFDSAIQRAIDTDHWDINFSPNSGQQQCSMTASKTSDEKNFSGAAAVSAVQYSQALPVPALAGPVTSGPVIPTSFPCAATLIHYRAADPLYAYRERTNARERERQNLDMQELDYTVLYASCCSFPATAQRLVNLLQSCISSSRPKQENERGNEFDDICSFLLWVMNLMLARSRHHHIRGLLPPKEFIKLNRKVDNNEDGVGDDVQEKTKSLPEGVTSSSQMKLSSEIVCWSPTKELQRVVMTDLSVPSGSTEGWSTCTSTQEDLHVGDCDLQFVKSFTSTPPNDLYPNSPINPTVTSSVPQLSSIPNVTLFSPSSHFDLRPHINTRLTNHNQYLVRFLATQSSRLQPWKALSDVPKFLQLLEATLVRASSERTRIFAASILLNIPWACNVVETPGQAVVNPSDCRPTENPATPKTSKRVSTQHHPKESMSIQILPSLREIFSMPHDRAALGDDTDSIALGTGLRKSDHVSPPNTVLHSQRRALVPPVDFVVPQRLLHQRMTAVSTLLKFCEMSIDEQREQLKSEEVKLSKEQQLVMGRQLILPLNESLVNDFSRFFKLYLLTEEVLKDTAAMSKKFLVETRTRLETQGLTRSSLTVAAAAVETELTKLSSSTEHLFDLHSEVSLHAMALRDSRATADGLLRVFVDLNAELRRTQEVLRTARRNAQHKRDKWIDLEQYIAQAPERRKKTAEQLSKREAQEEETAKKLATIQRTLAEAQISHSHALAKYKKSETALNIIETVIVDLENLFVSDSYIEETKNKQRSEGIEDQWNEVLDICARLPSYLREKDTLQELLKTPNIATAPQMQEFLHSEAAELRHQLATPGSSEQLPQLQRLTEKLQRLETERKKRNNEVERLRAELQTQSDLQALIEKSSEMQAAVRTSDAETQRLVGEVEKLEGKVRSAELDLEAKKTDVRTCEQKFFTSREMLVGLIEDSNASRVSICQKALDVENGLDQFLADMTSSVEDSEYAALNRLLLHFTLSKESRTRHEFRLKIRQLIEVLQKVDTILSQIDDSSLQNDSFSQESH